VVFRAADTLVVQQSDLRHVRIPKFLLAAIAVSLLAACGNGTVPLGMNAMQNRAPGVADATVREPLALLVGSDSSPTMVEVPVAADALADSIGVATEVSSTYGASDFPILVSLVRTLGVRHIRDGILNADAPYDAAMAEMLGTTAKLDGITDCPGIAYSAATPTSPASIRQFEVAIGDRLESVEGPNEVDERGDPNWAQDTRNCLPALRAALPTLPFIGPSLSDSPDNGATLGDISALVDDGNFHRYFAGRNPGTAGWGGTGTCGTYGALAWAMCEARINSGSKPLVVTETGYNSQTEVDETTQAKYLARVFLVNLKAGISKTFVYALRDYVGGDSFGGDGIVRVDDSVKPAFTAIQNELAYFSDAGTAPSAAPLAYALANANLDHLLFRKRDGSYVLALWNETASWNPTTNMPIVVAPQDQTVTFDAPAQSVSAMTIGDTGALVTTPTIAMGNTIELAVDDHVTLLHFTLH